MPLQPRRNRRPARGARNGSALDTITVAREGEAAEIVINQTTEQMEKEDEAMAEREASSGLLTDMANSIVGTRRDIAARSIDANVSFAKQMLDFQVQTTSWAKGTPMEPMFQSQYALSAELIGVLAGITRAVWRIERPKSES